MAQSSQVILTPLGVTILAAAAMAPLAVRPETAEKAPVVAATMGEVTFESDAAGKLRLLPVQTNGKAGNAMHDIFKRRHCVRSFQAREVGREDLGTILAAADSAPSAGGLKSREILVVADSKTKDRLVRAALGQEFIGQAPVVLVFWAVPSRCASKYGERGRDLFALQDATIAASFAWLQAVASGLGACWVGAFDDDAVKSIFRKDIERDWRPIALLPIGYAAE